VTLEDGIFQLEIKSKVLFVSFLLPYIESSLGSPLGVPQSPLNWLAIVLGTLKFMHLNLCFLVSVLVYLNSYIVAAAL
jgi:hypothetical protein